VATGAPSGQIAVEPGEITENVVTIDDVALTYFLITPPGFTPGDEVPALLAFPPGAQSRELAFSVMQSTYLPEASARGWAVVSPVAPDGVLFFDGSESLVPALLDQVESVLDPEGGRFHVAGISNGGISTFRALALQPDRFASAVVFPGYALSEDRAALDELTLPIRMYAGELDADWVRRMEETADLITAAGGDVTLEIVPGEDHVIESLRDGVTVFDVLDAARSEG
jgi:dipeptidyl aminopeptidase/acylaminoacyl peptidase